MKLLKDRWNIKIDTIKELKQAILNIQFVDNKDRTKNLLVDVSKEE